MTAYALIRSKRKTLSIAVGRDLAVTVRAPLRTPRREIDRFVADNQHWIRKQMDRLGAEVAIRAAFSYADGDRFPFGEGELVLADGSEKQAVLEENRLLLPPGNDRPRQVEAFLRERARQMVDGAIRRFAPPMGVTPATVKITAAAARWGSCSGRNGLCFSWRVACLPPSLVDYIVVHELAHIRQHNHSPRFWAVVGETLPDYQARRAQLREFQSKIPL